MRVGLIDIDNTKFPTLTLMKLSAWHKSKGDVVELIQPADVLEGNIFSTWDKIYASCIFDWNKPIAIKLAKCGVEVGGSGYDMNIALPQEVEHIAPDYTLYGLDNDTSYGFLTRGCPRQCPFCIVKNKEGVQSTKVADLSEWWQGQKNIELLDPNILACDEHLDLLNQIVQSKARVNFNQGLDIRLMSDEAIELINQMPIKTIHFAWDNPRDTITPKRLEEFAKKTVIDSKSNRLRVYVLTNYWSNLDEDLMRVYWLKDRGYDPYVMIYDKPHAPREIKRLQRWVNNKFVFRVTDRFEDYNA